MHGTEGVCICMYIFMYICMYIYVCIVCMCIFIQTIFIAPLQVNYYSEALPTQHRDCVGVSRQSVTGNCE